MTMVGFRGSRQVFKVPPVINRFDLSATVLTSVIDRSIGYYVFIVYRLLILDPISYRANGIFFPAKQPKTVSSHIPLLL